MQNSTGMSDDQYASASHSGQLADFNYEAMQLDILQTVHPTRCYYTLSYAGVSKLLVFDGL